MLDPRASSRYTPPTPGPIAPIMSDPCQLIGAPGPWNAALR